MMGTRAQGRTVLRGIAVCTTMLAACNTKPRSVASSDATSTAAAAATSLALEPAVIVATAELADASTPALGIAPATLTATWPQRIGQRVRFAGQVERSVDLTEVIVIARGQRFAVLLSPDQIWAGNQERTYTVMGAATVALRGRVVLPQLVLEAP